MQDSLLHVGVLCVRLVWLLFLGFVYAKGSILNKEYFKYLQCWEKKKTANNCWKSVSTDDPIIHVYYVTGWMDMKFFIWWPINEHLFTAASWQWCLGCCQCRPPVPVFCSNVSGSPLVLHGNSFYRPGLIKMSHPLYQYKAELSAN